MVRKTTAKTKTQTSIIEGGVRIEPIPATEGESVTISYDGLLAKSGATSVYTHIGYGTTASWLSIEDIPMQRISDSWTCDVLPKGERMNFCFHDGANNWDNNHGQNWSIGIHDGDLL